jgi:hypothetical protein
MTHQNRGRYSVNFSVAWQLYVHRIPVGWTVLGVIDRGGQTGALVESPAGILAQANAGALRSIDQRKARAALEAARGTGA